MREFGILSIFSLIGVVALIFQRSSNLKNNKIMVSAPSLYTFSILGARGNGLGKPIYRPEMHPMAPRGPNPKPQFTFRPAFRKYPLCKFSPRNDS
jgi:hypothetical protein